ncbi:TonB-dependent receptor plug domain-containing protein [Draconibacterium sp. IB214405]|uniref:TonB-dependent receptor n=1 Tax=Draconibacterium sp. IB214405 TaxID=3097352 RepID=UPI002A0D5D4F|nr:TonB-dependent receptor plug domain-containing protein [Draconibacterium sp. IB214405]MDX8340607.1 TonB-dependent receptor plug domain-containing protein [Draconibacterium sp. IB214405]
MSRLTVMVLIMLLSVLQLAAQNHEQIEINTRKTPLNQVLIDLKEKYGFQFAYDSDLLSGFLVSANNKTFDSDEEALRFLIKDFPLEIERSGDVLLIIPKKEHKPQLTRISGQVLEANTFEPLPYSYILINRRPIQSDLQGHFNFIASADTSYNLHISHLGYFVYDTIVTQSLSRNFLLYPQIERIKEVKVYSNAIENSTLIGDKAGRMKINHQIAPILPGYGDNSVFNLLRLMPGVMASGEQSNDLLIWGAYESHSKIQFDGFTVFGLKNFNDNIAVVNPLVVKNIEVMKGGYEARYGDRVGGIVDIQGKDGTLLKPTFTFSINSITVNSMVQLPISKKSSLLAAYRQTYYQLYGPTRITIVSREGNTDSGAGSGSTRGNGSTTSRITDVKPDFVFRDANLKYTFKGDNGSRFSLSLYGGGDDFSYDMDAELAKVLWTREEQEQNNQLGGSAQFSYPWNNGDATNLTFAYSALDRQLYQKAQTENYKNGNIKILNDLDSENKVNELSFNAEHTLNFREGHRLLLGAGVITNKVELSRFSEEEKQIDINNESPRIYSYLQDEYPLGKFLEIKSGLRFIYNTKPNKCYVEPRVSASVSVFKNTKINAAWGLYNQFLSKTTVLDSANNYTEFWTNSDDEQIPVLSAEHFVTGISYNKNGFTASAEAFYKTTNGLSQYINGNLLVSQGFYEGKARSKGVDLFIKKEYKRNMAWISYTLSNTEEQFSYFRNNRWRPAPHQQKHELKFAGVCNYKSFYLSANYVYGSGFERYDTDSDDDLNFDKPYSRLDAALVYKFRPGRVKAEAGISVLNILDRENIKYSNIRISKIDEVSLIGVYSDAISFTPSIFLNIEL